MLLLKCIHWYSDGAGLIDSPTSLKTYLNAELTKLFGEILVFLLCHTLFSRMSN